MYNQASTALFLLLAFLMWPAYVYDKVEIMGSFYFALLILYRVIVGLIIKRHFWQIADEKISFYSLLIAIILSATLLATLILRDAH